MFAPTACYYDDATELAVKITFDQAMDTTVVPALGSFTFLRNAVPYVPDVPTWDDPTTLDFGSAETFAGTTRVDVELDSEDANLRTAGLLVHTVFDLDDLPVCP